MSLRKRLLEVTLHSIYVCDDTITYTMFIRSHRDAGREVDESAAGEGSSISPLDTLSSLSAEIVAVEPVDSPHITAASVLMMVNEGAIRSPHPRSLSSSQSLLWKGGPGSSIRRIC